MAYKNPEDQKAAQKRHYQKHKQKIIARSRESNKVRIKRNKEYILSVKSESGCVDCGESNPLVLDFDHVRGEKVGNVSDLARQAYSIKKIQKEIEKCEIRCANCHRIVTYNRRNEKRDSDRTERVCS
jgi:hypothetical protein|tara:strand:+ start:2849 stop:3229 length:381 start_codon:yes stop_codon:yes gene_type:complete